MCLEYHSNKYILIASESIEVTYRLIYYNFFFSTPPRPAPSFRLLRVLMFGFMDDTDAKKKKRREALTHLQARLITKVASTSRFDLEYFSKLSLGESIVSYMMLQRFKLNKHNYVILFDDIICISIVLVRHIHFIFVSYNVLST